jgi:hypothetical protein
MIKDFIARNRSVFFIGFLTALIFLAIITISEIRRIENGNYGPKLVEVDKMVEEELVKESTLEEGAVEGDFENLALESTGSVTTDGTYDEIDQKYGVMRVEYTFNGFIPKNSKAVLGQKVRWVNKSNADVYIKQKTDFFKEFKTPMLLPANGVLEFRLYKNGVWSYEDQEKKLFGSIIILKP